MYLDAHIHLWQLNDGEHIWIREKIGALTRDFTEDDFRALRIQVNVGGAVLVQAAHNVGEAERWLERSTQSDQIVGVIAWADLHGPNLIDIVRQLRGHPKFAGLRPLPKDTFGKDWMSDPRTNPALKALANEKCPVDFLITVENLESARQVLSRTEGLRICLNHGARPPVMTGQLEPWATQLAAFARETDSVVKCSGLLERSGVESTKTSVKPYVETLIRTFGSKRVMFGTNWPVLNIGGTYVGWVRMLMEILDEMGLSVEEKDDIMWRTCANFYRLAWPASATGN